MGASLQTTILQNLSTARSGDSQLHLHKAAALLEHAVAAVKQQHPEYSRVELAGEFRRGCELVSDFAVVAETKSPSQDEESGGLKVTVTDKNHFGAGLLYATGSADHVERLAQRARDEGVKPEARRPLPGQETDCISDGRRFLRSPGPAVYRAGAARRTR